LGLVAFTFLAAPGELNGPNDMQILTAILENPYHPAINELFWMLFNVFLPMPLLLASVVLPQHSSSSKLAAWPFLAGSVFVGFFAAGPYLSFRAPPVAKTDLSSQTWFTRNVTENKLVNWSTAAITLALPFLTHVPEALAADAAGTWQGFVDLLTTSRLACVSSCDLLLLYLSITALTVRDYQLRNPGADVDEARKVALLAALFPFLGTALYCAKRPPLSGSSK
jgi:hypothetical protein